MHTLSAKLLRLKGGIFSGEKCHRVRNIFRSECHCVGRGCVLNGVLSDPAAMPHLSPDNRGQTHPLAGALCHPFCGVGCKAHCL